MVTFLGNATKYYMSYTNVLFTLISPGWMQSASVLPCSLKEIWFSLYLMQFSKSKALSEGSMFIENIGSVCTTGQKDINELQQEGLCVIRM